MSELIKKIQEEVAERLAETDPSVELLRCELVGPDQLRVIVDHPGGVNLKLCEDVTRSLTPFLERFGIEVSSPGSDRPLTTPEHFQRFSGRRVKIRTLIGQDGRRNFVGELVSSDEESVNVLVDGTEFRVPYSDIQKANLAPLANAKPANNRIQLNKQD